MPCNDDICVIAVCVLSFHAVDIPATILRAGVLGDCAHFANVQSPIEIH